ncbi:TrmO family methyltransferase domain-containing protein [Pseudovibrio exalbescens]|uniref:TrmO family methyltransferase domain-containing protein n=1 Tax=Pseudovibrio exalbescens TaxID=197461 RepID=UPI0011AEF9D1|nr:TrmO family methyltransferase [Pseudovibrio exalbescens]
MMKDDLKMTVIGSVQSNTNGAVIAISDAWIEGLVGLAGFTHAHILWLADHERGDCILTCPAPYTSSADDIGVFASRSPFRPSPIGLSTIRITAVDVQAGLIETPYIDACVGTKILDIKPYFPSTDRVGSALIPAHFSHWPGTLEASAEFDWASEFREPENA